MSFFSDVTRCWRFSFGLREHLRKPLTLEQSKEIIKRRMERRAETFLAILRKAVYENEKSPYLKLLKLAGFVLGAHASITKNSQCATSQLH